MGIPGTGIPVPEKFIESAVNIGISALFRRIQKKRSKKKIVFKGNRFFFFFERGGIFLLFFLCILSFFSSFWGRKLSFCSYAKIFIVNT
jgi:hypothetical protein